MLPPTGTVEAGALLPLIMAAPGPKRTHWSLILVFAFGGIVLQKSKVATAGIFRENKKWETIIDSYTLNRVAEVAGEFNVRGLVPSHLYAKDAPTARRIFDHLCKTTFATQSP